jgi:hypothetical protein
LEIGQSVTIDGDTAPWVQVQISDGTTGWCFGLYLRGTQFEPKQEDFAVTVPRSVAKETEHTGNIVPQPLQKIETKSILLMVLGPALAVFVVGGLVLFVLKLKKVI